MCLLTNERYKTYLTGFSFGRLGHAPGVGLGGTEGGLGSKNFFPKFNQTYMCDLHEWHMQRQKFGVPAPWGLAEGPKGQISLNLNHKVNFKDYFSQTLCVFSQMKDIKYIRQDFHSITGVMPQGWDLGVPWEVGDQFFFQNLTRFGVRITYMNGTCNSTNFGVPASWGLGEGPKGQISLNLNYKVNFKDF